MSRHHALPIAELKTMFPVKSEPSDTVDVGKDSQCIRLTDDNPDISDTLNTNTSEHRHDKSLSEEMLLTVAYVKNESTSSALDYYNSNSIGSKEIHGQHSIDINVVNTEKTGACSNNNLRDVIDDENDGVHVKEEPQSHNFQEHDIHHVTDIVQYNRVGESDARDMGDDCPSSASQSRNEANKCTHERIYSGKTHFKCDGEKPYKCDECAYRTTQSGALKTHKLIHSGEKPYKCDVCEYSTTRSGNLKTHTLKHTGEKPYKCDECAFSTTQSGTLKTHEMIHTGEKLYKCDVCEYNTTTYGNFRRHAFIHTGEKPDKYNDLCAASIWNQKRRKLIHTGEKYYKCKICDYSTTTSGHLKRHELIHTGEKPYNCNLCDYSTTTSWQLKRHASLHTGEKPHKCDVCDYSTTTSGDLNTH